MTWETWLQFGLFPLLNIPSLWDLSLWWKLGLGSSCLLGLQAPPPPRPTPFCLTSFPILFTSTYMNMSVTTQAKWGKKCETSGSQKEAVCRKKKGRKATALPTRPNYGSGDSSWFSPSQPSAKGRLCLWGWQGRFHHLLGSEGMAVSTWWLHYNVEHLILVF